MTTTEITIFADNQCLTGAYQNLSLEGKRARLQKAIADIDQGMKDANEILERISDLEENQMLAIFQQVVKTAKQERANFSRTLAELYSYPQKAG
jgi:hypothetical protein